ncbi:hypothetical protein L0337_40430 [candidate division KSB1 bacterium]|nr:hypothetical protein [candidate division KSB1 bacterium]
MDYDSPWKEVVEDLFEPFLLFFFPHIHNDVDFSKGYEFLDKELQSIVKSSETGRRIGDKLAKVHLFDGSEQWLLIHIEIQGYEEKEFPERMYVYNYRIFDKFQKEVISLALLTDDNPRFRPNEYHRSRWGFEVLCRYPIVKIIDYRERWDELEASSNPFAIVVKAYLKTLETEGNVQDRYTWKKRFLLELYQRGMQRETILAIYKFIDWIMKLPDERETALYEETKTIEEINAMPYITTAERIGLKRGVEQGLAQGIEQGIEQSLPTVHQALATIIKIKFGEAGRNLSERVNQVRSLDTLQQLMAQLEGAQSLSEAEKLFDKMNFQN